MGSRRRRHHAAIVVLVAGCAAWVAMPRASGAAAAHADPVIVVDSSSVSVGETVLVALHGWPQGPVTVAVCGNGGDRGSEDCDQVGAQTVPIGATGTEQLRLTITRPPVGCPCVVRGNTSTSDLVRAASIDIAGVPGGTNIPPAVGLADPSSLSAWVHLARPAKPWPQSWYAPFGGSAPRAVVLTLTNRGASPMTGLRIVSQVGRAGGVSAPIPPATISSLAPGERRTVTLPFEIDAPAYGTYVVTGSVYGLAAPVTFRASTTNDPWALELLPAVLLLVVAQFVRRRERARKRERGDAAAVASALSESSPELGDPYLGRCGVSPYDQPGYENSTVQRAHEDAVPVSSTARS